MIKAALFDLDGTIIDTMDLWMETGIKLLEELQIKEAKEICYRLVPKSMYETCTYVANNYSIPLSEIELRTTWEKLMEKHYLDDVKLKGNVLSALDYLHKAGIKLAVTTATKKEMTIKVLTRLKINHYFDLITTTQEVNKSKDYPDVYLNAVSLLKIKQEECVVFEDAYHALRTLKQAGFYTIAVFEKTMEPYFKIVEANADYYLKDYFEILKMKLFL